MQINGPLKRAQFEELASDPVGVELVVGRLWKITSQNVFKVYDGAAVRTFADLNSAQTFQNKTLNEATFTQIATPANPSAGFSKLYPKTDGKFYTLDSAGNEAAVGSGSGGGVDNLIVNGSADDTASSIFVPYADAAGTRPVDGTGGAPTVTTAITTTNPLNKTKSFTLVKPASNVQGQGWAVPFAVPLAYRAKSLKISTKFIVDSGTFVAGSPGVDGDVIVYLYDITNSQLIEPSNIKLLSNSTTLSDQYEATFQTSPTGADYRLIFHVSSVSALAYTLKVDDVTVSPQNYVYGTPVTDWQNYTPTGTWITNTTYTGSWRRVGDSMEGRVKVTTSGAPNAATLNVNIMPSGFTIDTNKFDEAASRIGNGLAVDTTVNAYPALLTYNTATNAVPLIYNASLTNTVTNNITQANPFTWGAGDTLEFNFAVPITGWSSSVQTSDQTDTRVVAANVNLTGTQAIASATSANVLLTTRTIENDTHGAYNTGTGFYTAPVSGFYRTKIRVLVQSAVYANASSFLALLLKRNNISVDTISYYQAPAAQTLPNQQFLGDRLYFFKAGETIAVEFSNSSGNSATLSSGYIEFERTSGPSAIAASETVALRYTQSSGQSIPNSTNTTLLFNNKSYDTHNSYNTGTGIFTAPVPGKYKIDFEIMSQFASVSSTWETFIELNGGFFSSRNNYVPGGGISANWTSVFTDTVELKAGDTIAARVSQNTGASRTLTTLAVYNRLTISKVGML